MAKGKYEHWRTAEGLLMIEAWARDGLTDDDIADKIGISRSTLYEWKKKFSDISDALKRGKEIVDAKVENALLKRALGCKYTETRTEESEFGEKKVVTIEKEALPDTTAQIFWLKNRRPDKWRDRQDIDMSNSAPPDIHINIQPVAPYVQEGE